MILEITRRIDMGKKDYYISITLKDKIINDTILLGLILISSNKLVWKVFKNKIKELRDILSKDEKQNWIISDVFHKDGDSYIIDFNTFRDILFLIDFDDEEIFIQNAAMNDVSHLNTYNLSSLNDINKVLSEYGYKCNLDDLLVRLIALDDVHKWL
jgi:hypothetical protein